MVNSFPLVNSFGFWIIFFSEFLFFIDIVISFFKQEINEDGISRQDSLEEVAVNYFKNKFILDFITFLPLGLFFTLINKNLQFFWAIKALRI